MFDHEGSALNFNDKLCFVGSNEELRIRTVKFLNEQEYYIENWDAEFDILRVFKDGDPGMNLDHECKRDSPKCEADRDGVVVVPFLIKASSLGTTYTFKFLNDGVQLKSSSYGLLLESCEESPFDEIELSSEREQVYFQAKSFKNTKDRILIQFSSFAHAYTAEELDEIVDRGGAITIHELIRGTESDSTITLQWLRQKENIDTPKLVVERVESDVD